MFLDKVILLSAVTTFVYADFLGVGEEEAIKIVNCFYNILCSGFEKEPDEFKRLGDAANNEELQQKAIDSASSTYYVPYSGDLDDFIAGLHEKICKKFGYKESVAMFKEFVIYIAQELEKNNCEEEPENPVCEAFSNAMEEVDVMIEENEAKGICCDENKPNSERCQKDAMLATGL